MQNLIMNVRVTSDVRLFIHDGNNDVAKFNVLYSRGWEKDPIFFSASVFGKKAHTAAQYFKKNMELTIRCELQPVTYQKKDVNIEVQTFELIVLDFQMHGNGTKAAGETTTPQPNANAQTKNETENPIMEDEQEDFIIE